MVGTAFASVLFLVGLAAAAAAADARPSAAEPDPMIGRHMPAGRLQGGCANGSFSKERRRSAAMWRARSYVSKGFEAPRGAWHL